jgi:hypothetical protein
VTLVAEAVPALITEEPIPRTVAAINVRVTRKRALAMSSPEVVDILLSIGDVIARSSYRLMGAQE